MQIKVLFFASLKEVAGVSELDLQLEPGAVVGDVLHQLARDYPAMQPWLGRFRVAVNMDYAEAQTLLSSGDELALIPPVSGGGGLFAIRETQLNLEEVVSVVHAEMGTGVGAICSFFGVVRDNAIDPQGQRHNDILFLDYEAYAPMAEKVLAEIGGEIQSQFGACCAMTHRVGHLKLGEASIAIAVASAHRPEAFEGCRYAIEQVKLRVPIWKKETAAGGRWWVEGSGNAAAQK